MTKYFTLERIREACLSLGKYDSKWVLVPFVMAANEVSSTNFVQLSEKLGTDKLLSQFSNADLIGLPARGKGSSHTIRPLFQELKRGLTNARANDVITHTGGNIWGNNYTQLVSKSAPTFGLERDPSSNDGWKLAPDFKAKFERNLVGFDFSELLVWLHAFSGFDDAVTTWAELWAKYQQDKLDNASIASEFLGRFTTSTIAKPWPTTLLGSRPDNADFRKELIPSEADVSLSSTLSGDPLKREDWIEILKLLTTLVKSKFVGLDKEAASLAQQVIVGLATSKRVFLLGDPGTGKSEIARLIEQAFRQHLASRLYSISVEITDRTTETNLTGYIGLDGKWVHGRLTAPTEGGTLFDPTKVALIRLNEANRQDIEALLSLMQASLDSISKESTHEDHQINLGLSGLSVLSPDTYIVMTGNSPRDDVGRAPQSRPFRRRIALVHLPNPITNIIDGDRADFDQACTDLWKTCADIAMEDASDPVGVALSEAAEENTRAGVQKVLKVAHDHRAGVSFGLLRKVLLGAEAHMALGVVSFHDAMDLSLLGSVAPLLAGASEANGQSVKDALVTALADAGLFNRLKIYAETELSDLTEFGTSTASF